MAIINFTLGWSKVHGCDLAQRPAICNARGRTPTSLGWRSSESYRSCSLRFVGTFHLPLQPSMPSSTLKGWTTVIFGWMQRWMRSSPTFTEIDISRFHQSGRMPYKSWWPAHALYICSNLLSLSKPWKLRGWRRIFLTPAGGFHAAFCTI